MAKTKTIKLADLLVNTENYRYETLASQKEAIDKMIYDQGDYLYNLAEHIIAHGLNPNDHIQVIASHHDPKKYIVLEGNRRIVSIKLLKQPELIDIPNFSSLKKKFSTLHEQESGKLSRINEVKCTVYNDSKEADIWIGIKHGYGKNGIATETWGPLQKHRFGEKTEGKTSTTIQIIKKLKSSNDVPDEIKNNIETINTSNLDRLINDPEVREFLGIELNNGVLQSSIAESEVIKGLTKIVKDILAPNFRVKRIYSKQDRKDYIQSFSKANIPNPNNKAAQPWQFNDGAPSPKTTPKPKPNPKDRKHLIPKSCAISISKPKVNSIYHELQSLDITRFTNAGAVLFRVFVELSMDSYIEEHRLSTTLSAAKSGMNLQQKINIVADNLSNKKLVDVAICKGIKSAIKDANDVLGIDTWHAYVHNNKFSPKPSNLVITWDGMQDFMTTLWSGIK
jgi:hypothetical protein